MKHATVNLGGMEIPLIGIPPEATLDECDLCHEWWPLHALEISETGQILCRKCRDNETKGSKWTNT